MKKSNIMKKLYKSRAFWIVIAFLSSVSLWIYVISQETEEYKQTFRGVKVELVGEDILQNSRNMVITDLNTSTVTVEVSGPRRIVGSWSSDDLTAQIDVSKLTLSAFTSLQYTIKYPDGVDTSSVKTLTRTPETISFVVSAQTSKVIPVVGSFEGSVAEGFTAESPEFEPAVLTVYGPEAYLKNVTRAWVEFGTENVSSTYSVETGFILQDENGEECSTTGLSFSSDSVTATLMILEVKEIPLAVDLVNAAGATQANTKVVIQPDTITLAGDSAVLSGINRISLATIDLGDFETTFVNTYPIIYSDGLQNLSGNTEAEVTVEIIGLETIAFSIPAENIACINVTDGYTAEILTENLTVRLRGPASSLNSISSDNLRAVADLKDYNTSVGQFTPAVRISVDGFTDTGALGDYTISIRLSKLES